MRAQGKRFNLLRVRMYLSFLASPAGLYQPPRCACTSSRHSHNSHCPIHTLLLPYQVLSEEDYERVWRSFDTNADDYITYTEFNNILGPMIHPTISKPLIDRPRTPRVCAATAKTIAKGLKKKMRSLDEAFRMIDTDSSGRISHAEFIQALRYAGFGNMDHDASYELMTKFKSPDDSLPGIDHDTFIYTMEQYMNLPDVVKEAKTMSSYDAHPASDLSHAERLLSEKLWGKYTAVQKAFRSFDADKSGALSPEEFRHAIANMGVFLTDPDFRDLCAQYDDNGDGMISYDEFNKRVGPLLHPEALGQKIAAAARKEAATGIFTLRPSTTELLSGETLEKAKMAAQRLGVTAAEAQLIIGLYGRYDELQHALRQADSENKGGVSQETFQAIVKGLGVELADAELRAIATRYDANSDGFLSYDEINARLASMLVVSESNDELLGMNLMPKATGPTFARKTLTGTAPPAGGAGSARSAGSRQPWDVKSVGSVSTSAVDLQATEAKMRKILGRSWTAVYKDMQRKHEAGSGHGMGVTAFQDSMAKQGVPLTSKEVRALARKYTSRPSSSAASVDYERVMRGTFSTHK